MFVEKYNKEVIIPEDTDSHKFQSKPIFREIFESDCYNIATVKEALDSSENRIVWDVGAHVGFFTLLCKLNVPDCRVHTFECNPARAAQQKNVLDGYTDITIHHTHFLGYADDVIRCKSYISRKDYENVLAYIRKIPGVGDTSVRQFYEQFGDAPDVLKIDMEGGEVGILEEMRELGILENVKVITGEWHFDKAYYYVRDDLASQGFHVTVKRRDAEDNWNHFLAVNTAL